MTSRAYSGEEAAATIAPARVTFQSPGASAKDFFAAIAKQTGNPVLDARGARNADMPRPWDLRNVTFWHAIEHGRREFGYRLSPFHTSGALAAVADAEEPGPSVADGVFRVSVQRVALSRDFEDGSRLCRLRLLLLWEPRLLPFHVDVGDFTAQYTGKDQKSFAATMAGQGKQELTGARATTLALRFPAPPTRAYDRIDNLKGSITVVLPDRMLTFRFDKLAALGKAGVPQTLTQEKVAVSLKQVSVGPARWSFTLQIDNPPGVPSFESYQSWLGNNRIALEKDAGKAAWEPLPDDLEVLEESAQRAVIRYHFTESKYLTMTKLADWTLRYTTPHRILAVPASFQIPKIDLP